MIRNSTPSDKERILEIYTEVYLAMPEEIETLSNTDSIIVYEENQVILGFAHYIMNGTGAYLEIGVDSKCNIVDIGKSLWYHLSAIFKENGIQQVKTFHVQEDSRWSELYSEVGFEFWYSVYRLKHDIPITETIELEIQGYSDDQFETKMILESECFEEVRKANNIQPYNWFETASEVYKSSLRAHMLSNKDFIQLYMKDNQIVGASQVKNSEVELIFTKKSEQGKGYGSQILIDSIKRGKAQGDGVVYLNVLAQNEKALRLYKKHGFKELQTQACRRYKM